METKVIRFPVFCPTYQKEWTYGLKAKYWTPSAPARRLPFMLRATIKRGI
jgi:hypothetical protein